MNIADWLTFLAWEFFASVLVGTWLGRFLDRRLDRLAAKFFIAPPTANLTPPTVTELNRPTWTEDA